MCRVPGCSRCFGRGEHLKRHIRCLHTNENRESQRAARRSLIGRLLTAPLSFLAFTCDYPGCEKEFSRQDNLHQHMRVHKGYVPKGF